MSAWLSVGAGTAASAWVTTTSSTTTTSNTVWWDDAVAYAAAQQARRRSGNMRVADGQAARIELPDGTVVDVAKDGSFKILDADAKVTYRACRIRNFNPFLNASDKLEAFIRFCGQEARVRRDEMLDLPLKLFIGWLVMEAAKADGEPEPTDIPLLPDLRRRAVPRCLGCGRFMSRRLVRARIVHCSPRCLELHTRRLEAA